MNASWTLKVDLVCELLCRLLGHLDARRQDACVPEPDEPDIPTRPLLDFQAGYVLRALDRFPRQSEAAPWQLAMSYSEDVRRLRRGPIGDSNLRCFSAVLRSPPWESPTGGARSTPPRSTPTSRPSWTASSSVATS